MNEVNESDSGSTLESVVQSRTDSDGALNPTVQSAAMRSLMNRVIELVDDIAKFERTLPEGLTRNYVSGARRDIWRASHPLEIATKWAEKSLQREGTKPNS